MSNVIKLARRPVRMVVRGQVGQTRVPPETAPDAIGDAEATTTHHAASAEALIQQAYARGHAEGCEETAARLEQDFERALTERDAASAALARSMSMAWNDVANSIEHSAARFAFAVAEMIVRKHITADEGIVVAHVKDAVRRVVGIERVLVRINPADATTVAGARASLLDGAEGVRDIRVEPDASIERGGCVLESESGNVDARITTELKRVEEIVFGAVTT